MKEVKCTYCHIDYNKKTIKEHRWCEAAFIWGQVEELNQLEELNPLFKENKFMCIKCKKEVV